MRQRNLAVWAALSALLQSNFLLELVLHTGLPLDRSLVSEISVQGTPHSWVFRVGDVLSALLLLPLLPALRRGAVRWQGRTLVIGLGAFAIGLIVAAIGSQSCAPTLDPTCPLDPLSSASPPLRDRVHDIASITSVWGLLIAGVMATWMVRRTLLAWGLGAAIFLTAALGGVSSLLIIINRPAGGGYIQRAGIIAASFLVLQLAWVPATRAQRQRQDAAAASPAREPAGAGR